MNRKVLFIGNSHSYFNDMPEVFARLCERGPVSMWMLLCSPIPG